MRVTKRTSFPLARPIDWNADGLPSVVGVRTLARAG